MYTILVNDDNTLYGSHKERIMHRSKLVDNLVFIVDPIYRNIYDMTDASVLLEYVLPISRRYKTVKLKLSEERYNGCFLQYKLPFDTDLTSECGSLELTLTFAYVEMDASGNCTQRVRKTDSTTIEIIPITTWCDVVPDEALGAFDKELLKIDARIRAIDDMNQVIIDGKADSIKYNEDENSIQLLAGDNAIGNKVVIKTGEAKLEDGVPVVDFATISEDDKPMEELKDDVVEF